MLFVKHANHGGPLYSDQSAVGHCHSRGDAQRLSCEASFAEKVTGGEHGDNGFLPLLGCNGQLYLALPEVVDRIRRLALPEDIALGAELHCRVAPGNFREDGFPIDR